MFVKELAYYTIYSKYWNSQAWANSVDTDQMPQNVTSDQGLHFLPLIQWFSNTYRFKQPSILCSLKLL